MYVPFAEVQYDTALGHNRLKQKPRLFVCNVLVGMT